MESHASHELRHRLARAALAAAVGGVVGLLATPLVPAVKKDLGPATVTASARLQGGVTVLHVPPLGTVSAPTHDSVLSAEVTLASVDFAKLLRLSSSARGRDRMVADLESDLRSLSVRLALQLLIGAALAGAVAATLVFHHKWRLILAGALGGALVTGATLGVGAATFDPDAFEEPRYTGALVDAPEVIETVRRGVGAVEELQSRYEVATGRLSRLLVLMARPNTNPRSGSVAILHVSDIHSNPLGAKIADQLAREFEVDAVLDTGDIGTYGEPIETNITKLVDDVPVPYVFVPGNHDSPLLEREMGRVDNVRVLLHDTTRIKGIRILGWGDPWFSESHDVSFDEGLALKRNVGEQVARGVRRTHPDILAVHDKRLAEPSYGNVPLVLSGHYHERQDEEVAGTRILAVGSTGATGLKSFALDTDQSYEAEVLYFRRSRAVAMDYITLTGFGEDFLVQRTTLEPVPSDKEEAATD